MALPGAGGGGRRPDFSAARRALNASRVLDPAPDGLNVECLWVANDVPIFLMAAASFRLCCLLKDMIVSAILSGCTWWRALSMRVGNAPCESAIVAPAAVSIPQISYDALRALYGARSRRLVPLGTARALRGVGGRFKVS